MLNVEVNQHAFVGGFFWGGVLLFTCAANVRPHLHLLLLPAIMAARGKEGGQGDETKMQMERRNPLVSTQGLFLARLAGDRQLASALNAEALWSLFLCAQPLFSC